MTWNQALETGGVLVGKKIAVQISAEAVRQQARVTSATVRHAVRPEAPGVRLAFRRDPEPTCSGSRFVMT